MATAGDASYEEEEGVTDLEVEALRRKKKVPAPVHCGVGPWRC